jgi:hypothetical protein
MQNIKLVHFTNCNYSGRLNFEYFLVLKGYFLAEFNKVAQRYTVYGEFAEPRFL